MRYKFYIVFSDNSSVLLGAHSMDSALCLVDHLCLIDLRSVSISLNDDYHD